MNIDLLFNSVSDVCVFTLVIEDFAEVEIHLSGCYTLYRVSQMSVCAYATKDKTASFLVLRPA